MSNTQQEPLDTGSGFIQGADPRTPPLTAAQWAAANGPSDGLNSGVFADPRNSPFHGQQAGQPQQGNGRFYSEAEVGAIRKEEKDKLYDRLTAMESELATARADREAREAAQAAEKAAQEAALQASLDEEKTVRQLLSEREQAWENRFKDLEADRARERALLDQERRFNEVQEYRRNRIEQESNDIFPQLRDLVQGASEAEIDASIELMKQRSLSIDENYKAGFQAQRAAVRGTQVTAPPVGPMEQQLAYQTLTERDIAAMDPAEYARNRPAIMEALRQQRLQGR